MNKYLIGIVLSSLLLNNVAAQKIIARYTSRAFTGPFTGSVLLYLSKTNEEPRTDLSWPCYRLKVKNVKPGEPVVFSDAAISYPTLLSRIGRGDYYIQAVWDINAGGRLIGTSPGNPYSHPQKITLGDTAETFTLVCDKAIDTPVFVETKYVKEIKAPSALLGRWFHKPATINGAIILPKEYYEEPARRFPLVITVSGFGGGYMHYSAAVSSDTAASIPLGATPCIKLYLDGNCPLGHSAYANSDNNGPVGDAFATEFLPYIDMHYRTNGARMIRGHSSGGWTVAYLVTHYPKLFVAGNASAPDPVDFRKFSFTDIYTEDTLKYYVDGLTIDRPAILDSIVYDKPNIGHSIEDILYRGQQDVSFDAVFGPNDGHGFPVPMFNFETMAINHKVVEHWKRYDITQYVLKNWRSLKTDLAGKLRISVGTEDLVQTLAVRIMEGEMKKLPANIEFAYYPGNHFTVTTAQYRKDEAGFLEKKYLEWLRGTPKAPDDHRGPSGIGPGSLPSR
jgi:hypothetical protein